MSDEQAIRQAVDKWFAALNAMFDGDPTPFADLWHQSDNVLYFSAEGTSCVGWRDIYADWSLQAAKSLGATAEGNDVRVMVTGDTAVAHYRTTGSVRTPDGQTTDMALRESSVYRKVAGQWKLVAHHADDLSSWEDVMNARTSSS